MKERVLIKYLGESAQVSVPESVEIIGDDAFQEHKHIEIVILPQGLLRIGKWAFSRCSSLEKIEIPQGAISIGLSAFRSCTRLRTVMIPDSMEQIMGKAFEFCKSLKSIRIPGKITVIAEKTFSNCAGLDEVVIEDGIKEIGAWAFEGCTGLKSMKIPDSVEVIGECAFFECMDLSVIEFGRGIERIKYNAFGETAWLENQTDDFIRLKNILIKYKGKGKNVYIPSDVSLIGCGAFEYNRNLETVILHDKIMEIDDKAFYDCINLITIQIPSSIKMIHPSAFVSCHKLYKLILSCYIDKKETVSELWKIYHGIYAERITDFHIIIPSENHMLHINDIILLNTDGLFINYDVYDKIFTELKLLGDKAAMAVTRLLFPFSLSREGYCMYYNYLRDNAKEVAELFIRTEQMIYLRVITELSLLPCEIIDTIIELSTELKKVEMTGYLLGYKNEAMGYEADEYSL
jgi:hypothetical protein